MKTIILYRPIGEKELELIAESGFKKFPPRLDWQPIFYPVLNEEYASEIARKWNTTDPFGNYLGFVTKFEITEEEFQKYKVENVGGKIHNELWVPSQDLEIFNDAIQGTILVTNVFVGKKFRNIEGKRLLELLEGELSVLEGKLIFFLENKSRDILDEVQEKESLSEEEIKIKEKEFNDLKKEAQKVNSIQEAVLFLIKKCLSQETLKTIKNQTLVPKFSTFNNNHFGINRYLRNLFFHGNTNQNFLNSIKNYNTYIVSNKGEKGEGILEDALWREIHSYKLENSQNFDKIKKETLEINVKIEELKIKFGLLNTISELEYNKIYDKRFEEITEELKKINNYNSISRLNKIELWSYDIEDKDIEEYLDLEKKIKEEAENILELRYKQKSILAKIKENEREDYQRIKSDYFNLKKIVEEIDK